MKIYKESELKTIPEFVVVGKTPTPDRTRSGASLWIWKWVLSLAEPPMNVGHSEIDI